MKLLEKTEEMDQLRREEEMLQSQLDRLRQEVWQLAKKLFQIVFNLSLSSEISYIHIE